MDTARFIEIVKREQAATALEGTLRPKGLTQFHFGEISGLIQGYERVLQILKEEQDATDGKARPVVKNKPRNANPYLADLDAAPTLPEQFEYGGRR